MSGVYISYPFCSQKCTYCNFASGVFSGELEARYVDALVAEIKQCRCGEADWGEADTVYLGGGTPSQMSEADLERVLSAIPSRPWKEATMEAAPGSITEERVRAWRRVGINRVSLGVQSFDARELARTGRKHTAAIVEADVSRLREFGIDNINIDLIAGLPGQTAESWLESLKWIERLRPPHVSVYMLEVDQDSRLGSEVLLNGKRYGARDVPSDELIVWMYEQAVDSLEQLGIPRYEISNFARPGWESLHNLKYWRLEPYAGFGADAHSFDGKWRWQNLESPREYADSPAPQVERTLAKPEEEKFFVGLRLSEGVQPAPEEWKTFAGPIQHFVEQGLLEKQGGSLRLTRQGVLLSNEVFAEFL
jgi:oxygen-independent coproporphyrinogen-3 oxidase